MHSHRNNIYSEHALFLGLPGEFFPRGFLTKFLCTPCLSHRNQIQDTSFHATFHCRNKRLPDDLRQDISH